MTVDLMRSLMVRAIGDKGEDYIYSPPRQADEKSTDSPECLYFNHGEPSCLFGHVASFLGWTPDDVTEGHMVGNAFAATDHEFSQRQIDAAEVAQSAQDSGATWGDALREYDKFRAASG